MAAEIRTDKSLTSASITLDLASFKSGESQIPVQGYLKSLYMKQEVSNSLTPLKIKT